MELSKQVISLELAKRLKELGVKQDSVWHWVGYSDKVQGKRFGDKTFEERKNSFVLERTWQPQKADYLESYSAFTVAELGEMLPLGAYSVKIRTIKKGLTRWTCTSGDTKNFIEAADTEADARAKLLIWLIENKLVGVDFVR